MELKDKIALVTGGSRGIGREVAIALGREGCEVLIVGRDVKKLNETKQKIVGFGGKCEVFVVDLRNLNDLSNLVKYIKNRYLSVNILCNIAGVYHSDEKHYLDSVFEEFSIEAIADSLDVGIKASMILAKELIPLMKNEGRIINTSGSFGKGEKEDTFEKGCVPDLITKKAIEMFTKQLAYELEDKNITVNAICPYYVWTENVSKFFPESKNNSISVKELAKKYVEVLQSNRNGEIIEVRK